MRASIKQFFAVSTLAVLLVAPLAAIQAAEPADPSKAHPFEKEIAAFEAADQKTPPPQRAILFVGDSTFTRWTSIHNDLPGYTVINRGFGGSQMSDLLYYTERIVLPYKPRLIVVQEGGNDIHSGKSPDRLLGDIKAFVEKVHAALPDVPIAIGSITPNSARWSEAEIRIRANKLVKEYVASQKNVTFVDFRDAFLGPDGKPNDDLFVADKMHPSPAGYQLRVRILKPILGAPDAKAGGERKMIEQRLSVELDIEKPGDLVEFLRASGRVPRDEPLTVSVLSGGVSNRTVLLERGNGENWVVKQALAKLRVAADWYCSPERIHREALGMRWLAQVAPACSIVPLIFEDHTHHLLAMQAVPQPHENWKTVLLRGEVDSNHIVQFGQLLGAIHRNAKTLRGDLETAFSDTSFFESLRLEPYYAYSAQQTPDASAFMNDLIAETRAHRTTLVHGDYSPKNVLVHNGRLILLDHEVIHWGDPAFDIGFSLTHLLSKAHHLKARRADFAAAAQLYWTSYDDASFEPRAVRHTLACLLARVAGRSPLEYLNAAERGAQRSAVLSLIRNRPATISELIEGFAACL